MIARTFTRRVIVESPYAHHTELGIEENVRYARACVRDCLDRGEAPMASHLLYTQPGILKDQCPDERLSGIAAGLSWGSCADATVVYTDRGISDGMKQGILAAELYKRPVEYRSLYGISEAGAA